MNENTSPKKRDHLSAFISNQNKSKKLIKDDLGAFISYEYIYKKNYENTSKKTMKVHLKKITSVLSSSIARLLAPLRPITYTPQR